jgi:hypothetical protein
VARAGPSAAAPSFAAGPARSNRPSISWAAATPVRVQLPARIHDPMLIGEVTLNIRSMFRNRSGRPRSDTSRAGLAPAAASATGHVRRASSRLPAAPAIAAIVAEQPASPPVKKYQGISQVHTGCLTTGRP